MLENQNKKCKICGTDRPGNKSIFVVDHCHKTDKIRGLLCHACNVGLGSFRDNINNLKSAIQYLENQ